MLLRGCGDRKYFRCYTFPPTEPWQMFRLEFSPGWDIFGHGHLDIGLRPLLSPAFSPTSRSFASVSSALHPRCSARWENQKSARLWSVPEPSLLCGAPASALS